MQDDTQRLEPPQATPPQPPQSPQQRPPAQTPPQTAPPPAQQTPPPAQQSSPPPAAAPKAPVEPARPAPATPPKPAGPADSAAPDTLQRPWRTPPLLEPDHIEPIYVPMALTVAAGFKFGCGFMMALAFATLTLFLVVSVVFFAASLMGVPLPFGPSF